MTRQLPATTCIGHAIRSVRNNIAYAFRISWPWYTLVLLAGLGAGVLVEYLSGGNVEAHPGVVLPVYAVLGFINLLSFASIAVNWHRYILLDEVPQGSELFRLDDKTWRYFGNLLLIGLIVACAAVVIVLPTAILSALSDALGVLVGIVAVILFIWFIPVVSYRLSVKLPAIALGRSDFMMRDAWAATQDNKLPIFVVALLQFLLVIAAILLLLAMVFVLSSINTMLGFITGLILQVIVSWIASIFGITILTSLYGFFVEGRDF